MKKLTAEKEKSVLIQSTIEGDVIWSKPKQECCQDITGFYLGTTCSECNQTFRSVIEEPKQETLEEVYLNKLIDEANKEFTLDRKLAKEVAIKFAKWKQERMYSEEDMIQFAYKYIEERKEKGARALSPELLIKQFKKK